MRPEGALRRRIAFVAMLGWMALIFTLSHQSADTLVDFGQLDLALKKTGHLAGYAVLGALAYLCTERPARALGIVVAYAISDEFHQTFVPGRMGTLLDVLIDTMGGAAAIAALSIGARRGARPGADR